MSAASASGYALFVSVTRYHARIARLRFTLGNNMQRRVFELAMAGLFGLITFSLLARQRDEDDMDMCYFGRDECGGDYPSSCRYGIATGVLAFLAALACAGLLMFDSTKEIPLLTVVMATGVFFLWLAAAIVLSHAASLTVDAFGQRTGITLLSLIADPCPSAKL